MEIINKKIKTILVILLLITLTLCAVIWAICGNTTVYAADGMEKYANAKIGDIVTYGNYYQDADGINKTPIEWLVVDKNEKTGQMTLLSKHVLAGGSYWGNYFNITSDLSGHLSPEVGTGPGGHPVNQSWADSTLRAWLNNLERTDVNGDLFTVNGIQLYSSKVTPSKASSVGANSAVNYVYQHSDLKYSVGYSNKNHFTGLLMNQFSSSLPNGYFKRTDTEEIFYKRPHNAERPAVNGFLDEAFTREEQERIVPRVIPGQNSHQWPNASNIIDQKVNTETTLDKVWVPSTAELNIKAGTDWSGTPDDGNGGNNWSADTDNGSSESFAFFRQFNLTAKLRAALRATGTAFDRNPQVSNYSIPLDVNKTDIAMTNMQNSQNYTDYWGEKGTRYYWTRTPSSNNFSYIGFIWASGDFAYEITKASHIGARPAIILSYAK